MHGLCELVQKLPSTRRSASPNLSIANKVHPKILNFNSIGPTPTPWNPQPPTTTNKLYHHGCFIQKNQHVVRNEDSQPKVLGLGF